MDLVTMVERSYSDSSSKSFSSPFHICSLVIEGRGGICAAFLWSALKRTVLACSGVVMVSENLWN